MERANLSDGNYESLKQGIDMVIKSFKDSLEKLGIKEVDTSSKFDPNLHEAVAHVSDESFESNTIVEVFQKGYIKDDKIIRYSMVKVAN